MRNVTLRLATMTAALAVAHAAHADASPPPAQPLAQPGAPAASDEDGPKSETVALALAIGGSVVGPALAATALYEGDRNDGPLHAVFWPMMVAGGASMILGPSLGNWYAGKGMSQGLGWRIGGAAVTTAGVALMSASFGLFEGQGNGAGFIGGGLIGLAGVAMVAGGTVGDIVSAPRAAAAYNRRHRGITMSFAPIVSRTGGAQQTGLAVVGSF